ncbi:opsin-5-like [Penaeus chinensis]|uniref:opsin-5-like n=1 Tax=Penaeus chinensis TaxID=139456 RepID=UPI001FB6C61C|nr:opsin-5-like [Penaeus chinensis]
MVSPSSNMTLATDVAEGSRPATEEALPGAGGMVAEAAGELLRYIADNGTTAGSFPATASMNRTLGDKFDSRLQWYEDYIVGTLLVTVGVLSILGNGSSVVMFWRRLRYLTPAEMLLLNMAVIHLFLAVASYPAAMAASFSHRWLFGDLGCAMYGFTCYFVGIATITSLLALAVVRYMKTCMHSYGRSLSTDHIKIILIGIYIYSLFWALLPLTSIGSYEVEPFGTSCTLNWADPSNAGRLYIIAAVLLAVIIPCLVIIWCYVKIFLLVRRNQKKKMMLGKRTGTSQPSQLQMSLGIFEIAAWISCSVFWLQKIMSEVLRSLRKLREVSDKFIEFRYDDGSSIFGEFTWQSIRTWRGIHESGSVVSWLVCLGFILAWIPYAVVSIYYGLGGHPAPPYVAIIPVLLAKSSCAYNPIIYIFVTPRYR